MVIVVLQMSSLLREILNSIEMSSLLREILNSIEFVNTHFLCVLTVFVSIFILWVSSIRKITEDEIAELARQVPHVKYRDLCRALGMSFNRAGSILDENNKSYEKACQFALQNWKDRTGGAWNELKKILRKIGLKGILNGLKKSQK